jgi:hypothetical protein
MRRAMRSIVASSRKATLVEVPLDGVATSASGTFVGLVVDSDSLAAGG